MDSILSYHVYHVFYALSNTVFTLTNISRHLILYLRSLEVLASIYVYLGDVMGSKIVPVRPDDNILRFIEELVRLSIYKSRRVRKVRVIAGAETLFMVF